MTARLVAVGQKRTTGPTLYAQYAIGEPEWEPVPSHDFKVWEPDPSDYRKQQAEDYAAWGMDL